MSTQRTRECFVFCMPAFMALQLSAGADELTVLAAMRQGIFLFHLFCIFYSFVYNFNLSLGGRLAKAKRNAVDESVGHIDVYFDLAENLPKIQNDRKDRKIVNNFP